jgi:putative Mg2+ transporter-C (MgtC) family protein
VSSEWELLWRLVVALALSSAIGIERELRQKSAGLRTHSLVGLGAALFVLVSTYGFSDVLDQDHVVLDPSPVAAQIVSGNFLIAYGYPWVVERLPRSRWTPRSPQLTYLDGHGILRDALGLCPAAGFAIADLSVHHLGDRDDAVAVELVLRGPGSLHALAAELDGLDGLDGILAVSGEDLTGAPD